VPRRARRPAQCSPRHRGRRQQIEVAEQNLQVTRESLDLTRQRFAAGVSDNLEVVQAQEALAAAELDRIDSIFAHNLAKLTLARALGRAAGGLQELLQLP
jgi:outer membrane protein TolC